ncbi:MAG: PadR family transcriptional regulator [Proteobacteria bacterium]|nr:PadR family transcriptional regulator [Pseudomonadota bacterium]
MNTKDYLPLTETSFLIILSLVIEAKHGYAILKEVELLSDRRVKMATGTLYSALRRMLEEGWIEQVEDADSGQTNRIRKFYRLTKLGHRIFEAESIRLRKLSEMAKQHQLKQPQ